MLHEFLFAIGSSLPHEPGTSCMVSEVHSFCSLTKWFIYHSNFPNVSVRSCVLVSIILRLVVVVGRPLPGQWHTKALTSHGVRWHFRAKIRRRRHMPESHPCAGRFPFDEKGKWRKMPLNSASHVSRLMGKRKSGSKVSPARCSKAVPIIPNDKVPCSPGGCLCFCFLSFAENQII